MAQKIYVIWGCMLIYTTKGLQGRELGLAAFKSRRFFKFIRKISKSSHGLKKCCFDPDFDDVVSIPDDNS